MSYKFLIMLPTYNRAGLVKTAVESVLSQDYDNYELAIIDDNEHATVERDVINHKRVKYVLTEDTDIMKKNNGGSSHGLFMNLALDATDADIAIILCDDDALVPGYLKSLNDFYSQEVDRYSYCHVRTFNPETESIKDVGARKNNFFANITGEIMPAGRVDASQVSWFISEDRFIDVGTRNLDMDMYNKLQARYGACRFNGIDGQYKAVFPGQLGKTRHEFEG